MAQLASGTGGPLAMESPTMDSGLLPQVAAKIDFATKEQMSFPRTGYE